MFLRSHSICTTEMKLEDGSRSWVAMTVVLLGDLTWIRIVGMKENLEGWDGGVGGRLKREGADSSCCMAETNTTLKSNSPPIQNK